MFLEHVKKKTFIDTVFTFSSLLYQIGSFMMLTSCPGKANFDHHLMVCQNQTLASHPLSSLNFLRLPPPWRRLQRTQNLLYESTRDFLQLKFQTRGHEKSWMAEKDRLLRDLDACQERLRKARSGLDDQAGSRRGRQSGGLGSSLLRSQTTEPQARNLAREDRKVCVQTDHWDTELI